MTVYDYDLHGLAQGAFQSLQRRAFSEQSLRDVPAPAAPSSVELPRGRGLLKKVAVGAAVTGLVGATLYFGGCLFATSGKG